MRLDNQTPFTADQTVCQNRDGRDQLVVILKATYALDRAGNPIPHETQQAMVIENQYHDEPVTSSLYLESDYLPPKPSTNVILVGHAYPPATGPSAQVDVGVQVGPVKKVIRVFGDRFWDLGMLNNRITPPLPFEKMPLIYERAYGGQDHQDAEGKGKREMRNPVGRGYFWPSCPAKNPPLPNLEDPKALISSLRHQPAPACFGFVSSHWQPRVDYVGTYDDAWRNSRFPLLPEDFDERHYHSAHADLITPQFLRGGEPVEAHNVTANRQPWAFYLPTYQPRAEVRVANQQHDIPMHFDTLLLQPDDHQFIMTWRGQVDVHNNLLKVTRIQVKGS